LAEVGGNGEKEYSSGVQRPGLQLTPKRLLRGHQRGDSDDSNVDSNRRGRRPADATMPRRAGNVV